MRLIHVKSFKLVEFISDEVHPYAILSHRWRGDEVSFEAISYRLSDAMRMRGFEKIRYCCLQAEEDGLEWCWVDTCCIDKRSGTELSEAFNSMYQWYQRAKYCYAYLEDVTLPPWSPLEASGNYSFKDWESEFLRSEWFSRGWTLQELIAPKIVRFFSRGWTPLGDKFYLSESISRHCWIDEMVLLGKLPVDRVNIATRMRWASTRKTTRIEDVAYCLLGIFDVNMPLLYGEGQKAFIRLQEEIIKRSDDHSIFTWTDPAASSSTYRSLFARSPVEFLRCQNIESFSSVDCDPFVGTNRGLNISLPLQSSDDQGFEYLATLNCRLFYSKKNLAVRLRRISPGSKQFARVDPYQLYEVDDRTPLVNIYVPEKVPIPLTPCFRIAGFKLDLEHSENTSEIFYPRKPENGLIRIGPDDCTREGLFSLTIHFQNRFANRRKRGLVVLFYNPKQDPHTSQAPMTDGFNVIPPNGYRAAIGTLPDARSTRDGELSIEDIEWCGTDLISSYVKMEMGIIRDEPVVIANVRIDERDFK